MQSISKIHVTAVGVCSAQKITKKILGKFENLDCFSFWNYGPFESTSAERVQKPIRIRYSKNSLRDHPLPCLKVMSISMQCDEVCAEPGGVLCSAETAGTQ